MSIISLMFLTFLFLPLCDLIYQGLVEGINSVLTRRREGDELEAELTRADIIKCLQYEKVKFRGVNFSGLDLSKLVSVLGSKFLEGFLLLSYVYPWQMCLSEINQ